MRKVGNSNTMALQYTIRVVFTYLHISDYEYEPCHPAIEVINLCASSQITTRLMRADQQAVVFGTRSMHWFSI